MDKQSKCAVDRYAVCTGDSAYPRWPGMACATSESAVEIHPRIHACAVGAIEQTVADVSVRASCLCEYRIPRNELRRGRVVEGPVR